jgi:hypothetical protein
MPPPTNFGVVAEREIYIQKEATPGTILASLGSVMPFLQFDPSDDPMWLDDESSQGSMGDIYGTYQGPLIAGLTMGGNFFGDHGLPEMAYDLLGDYTTTANTTASPAGVTNAPVAAGATALPVASGGASFTSGMYVWIQDAGSPAANEVVTVGAGSTGTSVVLSTPARFAHASATPFTNTGASSTFTHVFSVLNGSIGAANGPAQGPTYCLTDRTQLPATYFARQYAYGCCAELTITGNAEQLLKWTAKLVTQTGVIATSVIGTANPTSSQTYPAWRSTVGIGSSISQVNDIAEWSITLTRALKAYNTAQGAQAPYIIARGKQGVTGSLSFGPAISEAPLLSMLGNTQLQHQFVASNGLAGANQVILQADVLQAGYRKSDIQAGSDPLFGYTVPWTGVHTASTANSVTTTGASGGKGAIKLTITNAIPSY